MRNNTHTPADMPVDVPGLLEMSDLLRARGVETKSFHDQQVAEAAYRAGYIASRKAIAELLEAVLEYREALQAFSNDGDPDNWARYENSEDRLDAAIANCKPSN